MDTSASTGTTGPREPAPPTGPGGGGGGEVAAGATTGSAAPGRPAASADRSVRGDGTNSGAGDPGVPPRPRDWVDEVDSDTVAAPAPTRARWWARMGMWPALVWSVAMVGLAVAWAAGLVPVPFGPEADVRWSTVLAAFDPSVGISVTAALGAVGAVCAGVGLGASGAAARRAVLAVAWLLAGTVVVVLLNGQLIVLIGYGVVTPVLGAFVPGMVSGYVTALASVESFFTLFGTVGALLWATAALGFGRKVRAGCGGCGRTAGWSAQDERRVRRRARRVGLAAVLVASLCGLFYPAIRLPWLFGIPMGLDAAGWEMLQSTPAMLMTGVGLGTAAFGGVVLMWGLVRNWGVRFPRWMIGLAGRRVPVSLAVVPAALAALGFTAVGRGGVLSLLAGDLATPAGSMAVQMVAVALMLPWGLALGVATAAYAVRRRAECGSCGRGLPEELPV